MVSHVLMFGIFMVSNGFMVYHVCCLFRMFGAISHDVSRILIFSHGSTVLQTCHS